MLDSVEMCEVVRETKGKAEWEELISHPHFNQSTWLKVQLQKNFNHSSTLHISMGI